MTLPNGETIREGEYGVTRDGQKVGPILRYTDDGFFHVKGTSDLWLANGEGVANPSIIAKWHPVEAGPDPVKPNYNDGNWHAWHGGECPVHPKSVVEVRFSNGEVCSGPDEAEKWYWLHDGDSCDIHQFRVITPYAKPAPEPVKPTKRDLRTINEPFGKLDERTQKRLRKAAKRGWPVEASAGNGIWHLCTPSWLMGLKYRLDPTFTPPEKRDVIWLSEGDIFDSKAEAIEFHPHREPRKFKECRK